MLDNLMTFILFLFVFCLIVVSHEFGHYIVAKINGIHVAEFGIGMGPKLISFHRNGTDYCIRLFPLGGACIYDLDEEGLPSEQVRSRSIAEKLGELASEHDEYVDENTTGKYSGMKSKLPINSTDKKKAGADDGFLTEYKGITFNKAPLRARIATILAGPIFNFILAYLLALIVVWNTGSTSPVITGVMEDYPAAEAGIQPGDVITEMNGSKVRLATEIYLNTYLNKGHDMTITYLRDGKKNTVTVTPKYNEEEDRYLLGFNGYGKYVSCKNSGVFKYAYYEVRYGFVGTFKSLIMLVTGNGSKDDVAGPVGMAQIIDETKDAAAPYGPWVVMLNMFNLAMLLSVNLGILNMLPLPAIDGGRFLFMVIEGVRGKPVPADKENIVHLVGVVLLLILMVFVMYNDILRWIG